MNIDIVVVRLRVPSDLGLSFEVARLREPSVAIELLDIERKPSIDTLFIE